MIGTVKSVVASLLFAEAERPPLPFRESVRVLSQYESRKSWWRVFAAGSYGVARPAVPIVAAALAAWLLVETDVVVRVAATATVVAVANEVAKRLGERWPWHAPVTNRLGRYEASSRERRIETLLQAADVPKAVETLRRAQLIPNGGRMIGRPPEDAVELDRVLFVHEPAFKVTEGDIGRRVADVLHAAAIRARVGGWEAIPGRPVVRWTRPGLEVIARTRSVRVLGPRQHEGRREREGGDGRRSRPQIVAAHGGAAGACRSVVGRAHASAVGTRCQFVRSGADACRRRLEPSASLEVRTPVGASCEGGGSRFRQLSSLD